MNRAERRRNRKWTTSEVASESRCPDCDADVTVIEVAPGMFCGQVAHDDTCPWWRAYKASYGDATDFRLLLPNEGNTR